MDISSAHPTVAVLSPHPGTRAGGNVTAAALQLESVSAQPGTRAGVTTTTSAFAESDLEHTIRNRVEHRVCMAHHPALAITDNETAGEEEARPHTSRRAAGSSSKLRSANTAAMHTVIWPHEYMYTPEGQPSEHESMSSLAFVEGYNDHYGHAAQFHQETHMGTSKGPHA